MAREFAELYAGHMCENNQFGTGRIVGYSNYGGGRHVVVEFLDRMPCWNLDDADAQNVEWVVSDPKWGWKVRQSSLTIIPNTAPKKIPPPKAYPSTCPHCNSPARNGRMTMCSNIRCKSWKSFRSTYPAPNKPVVAKSATNNMTNPETGRAFYLVAWKDGGCIICGSFDRGGNAWAHDNCFQQLRGSDCDFMLRLEQYER